MDYRHELEALAKLEDKSEKWGEDTIVRFLRWYESDDKVYLAMEYFELGDLSLYLISGEISECDTKGGPCLLQSLFGRSGAQIVVGPDPCLRLSHYPQRLETSRYIRGYKIAQMVSEAW